MIERGYFKNSHRTVPDDGFGVPNVLCKRLDGNRTKVHGQIARVNIADGRSGERKAGRLIFLKPGETRGYNLEVGVLSGPDEISAFEEKVKSQLG